MRRVLKDGVRSRNGNSGWLLPGIPASHPGKDYTRALGPLILMFCFGHECGQKAGWYLCPNSYAHFLIVT